MQSLSRAFKRGNAVMIFNSVTKQIETVFKKKHTIQNLELCCS